jgi:LytS/YehU family sensor histidine kinase
MFDPIKYQHFTDTFKETYFQISIIADTMVNCFILMLAKFIDQAEVVQRQEQHIKEIESEILRVKYQQLRAQVNPHFLFNTLNILISLINTNPNKATEFTKQLAAIYRYLLSNDKQDVVLLSEELKFTQQYAQILNIRYGEGIKINIPPITDVAVTSMRIIPTALQILIENAVKHNTISTTNPLTINLKIDNNNIIVSNNLAPRPIPADSTGLGLKGLKEKYKIIANKEIKINQTDTTFNVSIPLMTRHEIK